MPPSTTFSCSACGVSFNDSLSHGMHLLSRKHLEKIGQLQNNNGTSNNDNNLATIHDLRMLIERKRAEKETALFGSKQSSSSAITNESGVGRRPNHNHQKGYFGLLMRDPAPHDDVVAEMKK